MKLVHIVDDIIERLMRSEHIDTADIIRCALVCAALFGGGFLAGVVLTLVLRTLTMWLGVY